MAKYCGVEDYWGMPWVHIYTAQGGYYETAGAQGADEDMALHIPEGGTLRVKLLDEWGAIPHEDEDGARYHEAAGVPYVRFAVATDDSDQTKGDKYILVWHENPGIDE